MDRRLEHMRTEFSEIRAGRANPAVLDKVKVDYYGAPTPVNQLAAVSVTEARTLTIQPWDASVLRQIEKAIQTSDIGINHRMMVRLFILFSRLSQRTEEKKS